MNNQIEDFDNDFNNADNQESIINDKEGNKGENPSEVGKEKMEYENLLNDNELKSQDSELRNI